MPALILGVVALVSCQPLGIVALFLARNARRDVAAAPGTYNGGGALAAAEVIGWVCLALTAMLVLVVVGMAVLFLLTGLFAWGVGTA